MHFVKCARTSGVCVCTSRPKKTSLEGQWQQRSSKLLQKMMGVCVSACVCECMCVRVCAYKPLLHNLSAFSALRDEFRDYIRAGLTGCSNT